METIFRILKFCDINLVDYIKNMFLKRTKKWKENIKNLYIKKYKYSIQSILYEFEIL
jgi:hypothetical protein